MNSLKTLIQLLLAVSVIGLSLQASADLPPGPWGDMDQEELADRLETEGIEGWVHAANSKLNLYVFTVRNPDNFFHFELYPMITMDVDVMLKLLELKRHDKVFIKGRLGVNKAPQKHIRVDELEIIEAYQGMPDHNWEQVKVPEDFPESGTMVAKVHAVAAEGRILILEKGPWLFPTFVNTPAAQAEAATFFRNDKLSFEYQVRREPKQPVHLSPIADSGPAFKMIDKIEVGHGEPFSLKGALVMYPQSPQIIFNVFAIQQLTGDQIERNFTLINFENQEAFTAIREKLQKAWDKGIACAKAGRNKWVNPWIEVEAHGLKNVVSPNQANPQILLEGPDDIKVNIMCVD